METHDAIGNYLIQRLLELGVNHVFGVPGDFVLGFNKLLEDSDIQFINTCDEQGAGFRLSFFRGEYICHQPRAKNYGSKTI